LAVSLAKLNERLTDVGLFVFQSQNTGIIGCINRVGDSCISYFITMNALKWYIVIMLLKANKKNKWLSYRRETALQGGSVLAKSGRRYSADNIYPQPL